MYHLHHLFTSNWQRSAFDRFLHSTCGRAIARVLIVALVAVDMPIHAFTATPPNLLFVNNDLAAACDGQTPCFTTIQSAIDAAQPGDTIRIQPGTYTEQVTIKNKNATATSEAGRIVIEADPEAPIGSVILRGARTKCTQGHAILIQQSRFITIRGLTITGAGGHAISLSGVTTATRAFALNAIASSAMAAESVTAGLPSAAATPICSSAII